MWDMMYERTQHEENFVKNPIKGRTRSIEADPIENNQLI